VSSRFLSLTASALVALAVAVPALAQGKSGGKKPPKAAAPPSTGALSAPTTTSSATGAGIEVQSSTAASPFAWLDDASLIEPGSVWLGVSMMRWHGSGVSQTMVPVIDGAVGLAPRVQLGATVPRVAGGIGATFFSAKIGILDDDARSLKVAVSPTLEVLGGAVMSATPRSEGRTQWGLPVSVHVDRDNTRFYGSSGYFSPGIWYAGAGVGKSVGERASVSASFSRAWTSSGQEVSTVAAPRRNEISGGVSYDLGAKVAVFGSVGQTIGMAAEDGAGTTLSFGVSLSAAPVLTR
jgi:hypothetical protein